MEANRGLANALDDVVDLLALLFAHRVAEQASEQADVGAQRRVLFGFRGLVRFGARLTTAICMREAPNGRSEGPA